MLQKICGLANDSHRRRQANDILEPEQEGDAESMDTGYRLNHAVLWRMTIVLVQGGKLWPIASKLGWATCLSIEL
jgi:predicted peptidase